MLGNTVKGGNVEKKEKKNSRVKKQNVLWSLQYWRGHWRYYKWQIRICKILKPTILPTKILENFKSRPFLRRTARDLYSHYSVFFRWKTKGLLWKRKEMKRNEAWLGRQSARASAQSAGYPRCGAGHKLLHIKNYTILLYAQTQYRSTQRCRSVLSADVCSPRALAIRRMNAEKNQQWCRLPLELLVSQLPHLPVFWSFFLPFTPVW